MGLNRGGSYIDCPRWLKNKKNTLNPKINDMCFKYAVAIALNHGDIGKHPERLRRIGPFIVQCN